MTPAAPIRTLADLVFHIRDRWGGRPGLLAIRRRGRTQRLKGSELVEAVHALALGLETNGVEKGNRVGLMADNCPEWHMADLACHLLGAPVVPIYPELPDDQIGAMLRSVRCQWIFYGGRERGERLRQLAGGLTQRPHLAALEDSDRVEGGTSLTPLMGEGASRRGSVPLEHFRDRAQEDDLASVVFTSGTTSDPKGVRLSHRNLVAGARACSRALDLGPADVALSLLPLSLIFERVLDYSYFYDGVAIHYADQGSRIAELVSDVRPTILAYSPGLYERTYLGIRARVERRAPLLRSLFHWAVGVGERFLEARDRGLIGPLLLLERLVARLLVYRRIARRFGGRLRLALSGGMPLPLPVARFFQAVSIPLYAGYGLTEASSVVAVNRPGSQRLGTVGRPVEGVEVRLAPDGEILVRSPGVTSGYWENPQASAELLDAEGWLHTGDLGRLDDDGFLILLGRKAHILVTTGDRRIAPLPIQRRLTGNGVISRAVVVGHRRPYLAALLVPDFERLGARLGLDDPVAIARHPEALEAAAAIVDAVNEALAGHERIRAWRLLDHELTVDSGVVTATRGVRRSAFVRRYGDLIDEMYRTES